MNKVKELKIDQTRLRTQTEYAKERGISKARVNQLIKAGEIKIVEIKGATLIYV
jgi:hypothetical protein